MKINPKLLAALESRGLSEPTLAQSSTWPVIDSRKNVLLIAPTGVGKTELAIRAAFLLCTNNKKTIVLLFSIL